MAAATTPTQLFFATVGSATDNTWTENGRHTRSLMAFTSEAALQQEQEEVYEQSKHRENVITLPHTKAAGFGDQVLFADGSMQKVSTYLDDINDEFKEEGEIRADAPICVVRFKAFTYFTQPFDRAELERTELWYGNY